MGKVNFLSVLKISDVPISGTDNYLLKIKISLILRFLIEMFSSFAVFLQQSYKILKVSDVPILALTVKVTLKKISFLIWTALIS